MSNPSDGQLYGYRFDFQGAEHLVGVRASSQDEANKKMRAMSQAHPAGPIVQSESNDEPTRAGGSVGLSRT